MKDFERRLMKRKRERHKESYKTTTGTVSAMCPMCEKE
jgi:hypothetical protein